jgi:hypothetical protein
MKKLFCPLALLLVFIMLALSGCNEPGPGPTPTPAPTIGPAPAVCTDAQCFKQNAQACTKAAFTISEEQEGTTVKTEASIEGKEGEKCRITITLKEIALAETEPQNEAEQRIQTALKEYFGTLQGKTASCLFTQTEAVNTNFSGTAFIIGDSCSGNLKDALGEMDTKIEEIISMEGEAQ